ncbi:NEQ109 [Nanoarchaeum equitans Kin4-M]|uniref:NEQ109 n=1 Tax=Nanoarchaeum equitans (strain Kin4-M) TaxID=228908 RepID=Q74ML3_NANEQ|nr:NEQ109 [Nanoarchaeum equitans Kin4-M]
MRVKVKDDKVQLYIEDYEDLVDLFLTIEKGDIICAKVPIVIKKEYEKEKTVKYVCIEVEELKLDPYYGLRIYGRIVKGDKDVPLTKMSINLNVGKTIETQYNEKWLKFKPKNVVYVLCVDDEKGVLAEIYRNKYKIIKEYYREGELSDFIDQILKDIKENTIVCGPNFIRDIISSKANVPSIYASYGGEEGIRELLKNKEFFNLIKDEIEKQKIEKLEKAFQLLYKGQISIGEEAIEDIKIGNVEEVYVHRDYLKRLKERKEEDLLNTILVLPKKYNAKIYIIEGDSDLAKQLYFLKVIVKKRWF